MKKEILSYEAQLQTLLVLNTKAELEDSSPDHIRIRIKLKYTGLLAPFAKFFGAREYRSCELSGLGCEIYRMIEKEPRRLIELVYFIRDTQKLSFFEARNLILQYTGSLIRNGIIAVEALRPDSLEL